VQIYANNDYILGDIFSDLYYVMYDFDNREVGFNGYVLEGLPLIQNVKYGQD